MKSFVFLLILSFLFCFSVINAAGCHTEHPVPGKPNLYPINDGASQSKLVGKTKNGKLYEVTVPMDGGNTTTTFDLIHVYGTPYEMGFAQGTLLKQKASFFIEKVWTYFESQVNQALPGMFPKWLDNLIADVGLDAALELTELATREYTGDYFFEELKGIADAAGVDYQRLVNVHMIAGLTQGKCSMMGAWGKALDPKAGTSLLQFRALDWNMDGPFRDVPALTVYHPSEGMGTDFALVGMVGFIGGLTGISRNQLGISEIGVSYPDASFGSESRIGIPFIFLLRDILQFDYTVDDASSRMAMARRTCDLILGVGDGKLSRFNGYEYSYSTLRIYDDLNLEPFNSTWHPRIKDVVYWGMDWLCPGYNKLLSGQIQKYYGQITPELGIRNINAVEMSGDNHLAWYDLPNMKLWVSYAAQHDVDGPVAAYDRQFTFFDAEKLLTEQL